MLITELLGRREGGGKNRVGNQSMMWKHEVRYLSSFLNQKVGLVWFLNGLQSDKTDPPIIPVILNRFPQLSLRIFSSLLQNPPAHASNKRPPPCASPKPHPSLCLFHKLQPPSLLLRLLKNRKVKAGEKFDFKFSNLKAVQ
ncbi:hypothetical protein Csa_006442, partial [Cucumis sativus]